MRNFWFFNIQFLSCKLRTARAPDYYDGKGLLEVKVLDTLVL
jgi:hypothetical protein